MVSERAGKKKSGRSRLEKSKGSARLPPRGGGQADEPFVVVHRPQSARHGIKVDIDIPRVKLPQLRSLPQRSATQVKNQWADVMRAVRNSGGVAVTHHDRVEMVVMEAATYQEMAGLVAGKDAADQAALQNLTAEFDRRISAIQQAQTPARIKDLLKARGRAKRRPKAGSSF